MSNLKDQGLDARISYEPGAEELKRLQKAALEVFNRVSKSASKLEETLNRGMDEFSRQLMAESNRKLQTGMAERIKAALSRRANVETYPPAAVQFYLTAMQTLSEEGYVVEVKEEAWAPNPEYRLLSITPLHIKDALWHPPIEAHVIYHPKTGQLARREEILKALCEWKTEVLVDFADTQIYGLEILIDAMDNVIDYDGRAVFSKLKTTELGKYVRERDDTISSETLYGRERAIFFLPQTQAELEDKIPPPYHNHPRNAVLRGVGEESGWLEEMRERQREKESRGEERTSN